MKFIKALKAEQPAADLILVNTLVTGFRVLKELPVLRMDARTDLYGLCLGAKRVLCRQLS